MKHLVSTRYKLLILLISTLVIGMILGQVLTNESDSKAVDSVREYPMLSHRLFEAEDGDMIISFTKLREIMKARHAEKGLPVGIYFEYLSTGASIGVNDQFEVEIGSLTKVPAVMAVYRQVELGTMQFDQLLTIEEKHVDKLFGELWKKGVGAQITLREAVDYAIKYSDNTAAGMLAQALPDGALSEVFDQLDLPKTRTGPFPVMSPKSYSSVFRNLYLSTYLSKQHSNELLTLLSETVFTDKLPAGLPAGTKIAHKIGVFQTSENEAIYGDCGIIYVPSRPYALCVMVRGDENTARDEIVTYSKMVYSFVSQTQTARSD